jgi:hypothetical protein
MREEILVSLMVAIVDSSGQSFLMGTFLSLKRQLDGNRRGFGYWIKSEKKLNENSISSGAFRAEYQVVEQEHHHGHSVEIRSH